MQLSSKSPKSSIIVQLFSFATIQLLVTLVAFVLKCRQCAASAELCYRCTSCLEALTAMQTCGWCRVTTSLACCSPTQNALCKCICIAYESPGSVASRFSRSDIISDFSFILDTIVAWLMICLQCYFTLKLNELQRAALQSKYQIHFQQEFEDEKMLPQLVCGDVM